MTCLSLPSRLPRASRWMVGAFLLGIGGALLAQTEPKPSETAVPAFDPKGSDAATGSGSS